MNNLDLFVEKTDRFINLVKQYMEMIEEEYKEDGKVWIWSLSSVLPEGKFILKLIL